MTTPPNHTIADASIDGADVPLRSLVPLLLPVNAAETFACEPQLLGEDLLHQLFSSYKSSAEDLRRWSQTYRAPRNQFTEIGLRVLDAVFQDYAALLDSEWKSQNYQDAIRVLRSSLLQFRQAQEHAPLLIAHAQRFGARSIAAMSNHPSSLHEGEA